MHRRLVVLGRVAAVRLALPAGLGRRDRDALAGQDPREHGDRPQRHARPVGLDERPPDPLLDLGLGHRLDRRGLEALPQLRPPHLHEHPRQGPRPRLRDHADRPAPEVAPGLPRSSRSTTSCWPRSSSGASPATTSTSRRSEGREVQGRRSSASSRAWPARRGQIVKDYIAFPALSAGSPTGATAATRALRERSKSRARRRPERRARRRRVARGRRAGPFTATLKADVTANIVRNVWAYAIIFCGHFPDQTYTFSQDEVDDETRGGFYVRQLLGAANIEGSPLFHVLSGNLGYQVEHHLYPDMPSTRYAEIAPRVKDICERYELPYNTGPFLKQLGTVQRTILRLAFPGGKPRPKPGPLPRAGDGPRRRRDRGARFTAAGRERLGARAADRRRACVDARRGIACRQGAAKLRDHQADGGRVLRRPDDASRGGADVLRADVAVPGGAARDLAARPDRRVPGDLRRDHRLPAQGRPGGGGRAAGQLAARARCSTRAPRRRRWRSASSSRCTAPPGCSRPRGAR